MTQKQKLGDIEARVTCIEKGHVWEFTGAETRCMYMRFDTLANFKCKRCGKVDDVRGSLGRKIHNAHDKAVKRLNKD